MKKAISIFSCFLLGGCMGPYIHAQEGPAAGTAYPYQDTAPRPWVSVIPSERAISFKEVYFDGIAHQLRYDMNYGPYRYKFQKITRVLMDYGILPPEPYEETPDQMIKGEQIYPCTYQSKPERYVLTMKFYGCDQSFGDSPLLEETITMPARFAPPSEALHLMAHTIVEDLVISCLPKIQTRLN